MSRELKYYLREGVSYNVPLFSFYKIVRLATEQVTGVPHPLL